LQIGINLLLNIASTADEISGSTDIDDLNDFEPEISALNKFFAFLGYGAYFK